MKWSFSVRFMAFCLTFFFLHLCHFSFAHETRPAYLRITQTSPSTYDLYWKVPLAQGRYINITPSIHVLGDFNQVTEKSLEEAIIKTYDLSTENEIRGTKIRIENLEKTLIDVLIQLNFLDETSYSLLVRPTDPEVIIPSESSILQVIRTYFILGVEHIWLGYDHLLFVVGLFLLIPGLVPLIKTITSFTLAHSITLILATLGFINVNSGPVEAVIALSIVLLALEAYNYQKGLSSLTIRFPWIVAFLFGLIHGLGFAGALSDIGLPQKSIPSALLLFNIGVEFGQVVFVFTLFILFFALKKYNPKYLSHARIILPYFIGSLGMYWLIDRVVSF